LTDTWDEMLASEDAALVDEIKSDLTSYAAYTTAGNMAAAIVIEQKYGLFGLSPQQVSEQLREMTLPIEGQQS